MYISEMGKKNKQATFNATAMTEKEKGHAANAVPTWAITLETQRLRLDCTEESEIYKLKLKRAGAWRSKAECSSLEAGQRPFSFSFSLSLPRWVINRQAEPSVLALNATL